MKKRQIYLLIFFFLNFCELRAEITGYAGVSVYQNFWKVGFLDNRTVNSEGATTQFGKSFFTFPVFNGTATVILNRKWVSTYSFSYARPSGDAEISNTNKVTDCNGTPCRVVSGEVSDKFTPNLQGIRMDHDLSVGRLLGKSGFSVFGGVKYQRFQINLDETAGARTNNSTVMLLPSGPTVTSSGTSTSYLALNYSTEAIGPAIGVGYTRELKSWIYFNVQVSYLTLFGRATIETKQRVTTDAGAYAATERTAYIGHGGATAFALVFPIGEKILLQVAYRLQGYVTKVTNTSQQSIDPFGFQINQSTNKNPSYIDNAFDLYHGLSIGAQYRVF